MPAVLEDLSEEEKYLFAILDDPSGLDHAEFLWAVPPDADNPTGTFRAYPYQWAWWRCEDPLQIDQCARALSVDTPIPTPLGWTTMGELHPGDFVFDENAEPTKVLEVTPAWTGRACFTVEFSDGSAIVADREHLWVTTETAEDAASSTHMTPYIEGKWIFDAQGVSWQIVAVKETESVPVRCITVANSRSMFLAGSGSVPTKNSVGKSLSIKLRLFAFPFVHPGREAVITAPELVHLDPIIDLVEGQFNDTRLGREIRPARGGIKHKPFLMNFINGARIIGRIPQRTGRGVKGIHPLWLELDEAADYPQKGWTELNATLNRGLKNAVWRAHGVSRGVRDKFYEFTDPTNPDNRWTVHRIVAMARPSWTDEERQEQISLYGGSKRDPDYRRNVLGLHGDQTSPMFVAQRLMQAVCMDKSHPYNLEEYYHLELRAEQVEDRDNDILSFIDLPAAHTQKYKTFWIGMDVGLTTDPSEILVFAEYHLSPQERREESATPSGLVNGAPKRAVPAEGQSRFKLVTRISLHRIPAPLQRRVIGHLIDFYDPAAFAMDSTGLGFPIYQEMMFESSNDDLLPAVRERAKKQLEKIRGYNFSQKVLVDFDLNKVSKVEVLAPNADVDALVKEGGIWQYVLDVSTDFLRQLIDAGRLMLPFDKELVAEYQGQTFSYSNSDLDTSGRRRRTYSKGSFHALDGSRMAAMAHGQSAIEAFTAPKPRQPVLDQFVQF